MITAGCVTRGENQKRPCPFFCLNKWSVYLPTSAPLKAASDPRRVDQQQLMRLAPSEGRRHRVSRRPRRLVYNVTLLTQQLNRGGAHVELKRFGGFERRRFGGSNVAQTRGKAETHDGLKRVGREKQSLIQEG